VPANVLESGSISRTERAQTDEDAGTDSGWLVFKYAPVALFSLKSSRATSTAQKTLLTPTPYSAKMAILDAVLRNGLTDDPESLVRWLARATLRIGVPGHACLTGTIQSIRQETREVERKRKPGLPTYRTSIGMREFVHYQGAISLAFDLKSCVPELTDLLLFAAPAINYLGKRGGFIQYVGGTRQAELDGTFTRAVDEVSSGDSGHRAAMDDFGARASFEALNSFSQASIQGGVHRKFVETIVPLEVHNSGPGFVHYRAVEGILSRP
jgi:hypothetical protein